MDNGRLSWGVSEGGKDTIEIWLWGCKCDTLHKSVCGLIIWGWRINSDWQQSAVLKWNFYFTWDNVTLGKPRLKNQLWSMRHQHHWDEVFWASLRWQKTISSQWVHRAGPWEAGYIFAFAVELGKQNVSTVQVVLVLKVQGLSWRIAEAWYIRQASERPLVKVQPWLRWRPQDTRDRCQESSRC